MLSLLGGTKGAISSSHKGQIKQNQGIERDSKKEVEDTDTGKGRGL